MLRSTAGRSLRSMFTFAAGGELSTDTIIGMCVVAALITAAMVCSCIDFVRHMREIRTNRLSPEGYPLCSKGGYDLHALMHPRCPECGTLKETSREKRI
ncbi:MAG: hypothetical protein L0219_19185, partial [Phycisphaerales bacterium]|nr:hypothetical protein [Phycisphaerales bacterium]